MKVEDGSQQHARYILNNQLKRQNVVLKQHD